MPQCSIAEAAANPRAALVILHGLAEHAGRYRQIARVFAARGISTFAFDQRGHGDVHPRTHVDRFDHFVSDANVVCKRLRGESPALPLFVWGHSMGAIVALSLAAHHPEGIAGLIVTSNSLDVFKRRASPLHLFFRFLSRIVPRIRIPLGLDPVKLSHDEGVQRAYAHDPLIPGTATLRLLVEFAAACERVHEDAPRIHVPTLIVHGEADRIAPPSGSLRLYERLGAGDKELRIVPGLRHEIHNEVEPERTKFLDSTSAWMLARVAQVAVPPRELIS